VDLMEEKKLENVLLIGGGIIPKKDIESLEKSGVGKLYGPGTPVNETIDYITNWVEKNRR
jgi:methylmalonyl-CoA mutase C-terminal domain/subunit